MKDQIEVTRTYEVDEQITSAIGESKTYFTTHDFLKAKVSIINTGTKNFRYAICHTEDHREIVTDTLKTNKSYEQVFDYLPEGPYVISYLVKDEALPHNITLSVKVVFVEYM